MLRNEIVIERDPSQLGPRWLRMRTVSQVYSISAVRIYDLLNTGQLKSILLKGKGKTRGIRLISVESLEEYFNGQATTKLEPMKVLAYNPDNPVKSPGRKRKETEEQAASDETPRPRIPFQSKTKHKQADQ
jgi:hypothetical protein